MHTTMIKFVKSMEKNIALETDVPEVLAAAMGNYVFIVKSRTQEELFKMIRYILKREDGTEWM